MTNSRLPGFYKLTLGQRHHAVADALASGPDAPTGALSQAGIEQTNTPTAADIERILAAGGLDAETADKIVENVLGTYALPFGVALNFQINGDDRLIPMVVEEPSVIAAASNAAKMIRAGGGFSARMEESLMIAQIELRSVGDADAARAKILADKRGLLEIAGAATPGLQKRGGGPRDLEVRKLADDHLVVHLLVDTCDAMGANLVNGAAEHLATPLAELTGARPGLRILSNLTDRRRVVVTARAPGSALVQGLPEGTDPSEVLDALEAASVFAERDPYRAATHNKGLMNGVDSVVIATGNDYRAVEAGAHAYCARNGAYEPLATWRRRGDFIEGHLDMPLALGIVGGTLRVHPAARLALVLARVKSASDLSLLAGAAGLASNLAAIRALATEGIQRGHMSLHARSVAIAAGARGGEVETVALLIAQRGSIRAETALEVLNELRRATPPSALEHDPEG